MEVLTTLIFSETGLIHIIQIFNILIDGGPFCTLAKITTEQALISFDNIVHEIERLLERHFNEGTGRKNVIDLEIQRLINWSFDQPEEKLKIYNESIHLQQAFSGIEKGSDQENYLFILKLMAKRVRSIFMN